MIFLEYPVSLYFDTEPAVQVLDLCRGDNDFRKVYIANDGKRKLVIKYMSNTFSDRRRIEGWLRLMDAYRDAGIYCPAVIPARTGETICCETKDGRDYFCYAEEFAVYETAEHIGEEDCRDEDGNYTYTPDVMRSLGKIASAGLDFLDWSSAYCLLEPFSPPDTTDEGTECALLFRDYVKENLPRHLPRTEALLDLFYRNQAELKKIYHTLPVSCFQGDLNESNILLDENRRFAGLIDFNLCGREPVLNYTVREALWAVYDRCLFGENDARLCHYDKALDDIRIRSFLRNMAYVQETYTFSEQEREAFPLLFRYMNSFWWQTLSEIERVHEDEESITKLLDWLEHQMTRDDIRLP
ncbi:MAG: phosphotransferase [Clostridia bacterium]|nr:phosphotransferase [Clostridia bacterium]